MKLIEFFRVHFTTLDEAFNVPDKKLVISTGLRHNKLLLTTSFTKVGQYNFSGVNIDSFSLVDVNVNYDLDETTVLSANIHNFLDEDYVIASGFLRPGRTLFLGFKRFF